MQPWSTFLQPMPMTSFTCSCILESSLTSGSAKFPVIWALHTTMILYGECHQTWNASAVWENLLTNLHKCEHTMKYDSATLLVLLYCGISSGSFTNMADGPLAGGSHLVDFIAERAPTPSGANGDAREAETHDAPKPPSSAVPPSKLVALSSHQADL